MISLFTPEHRGTYLREAWLSIKDQTDPDFEWVIVVNGELTIEKAREFIADPDPRIKIFEYGQPFTGIGAIKKFACSKCTGDILLELDGDDLLAPTTIEELKKAASEHPDVAFFYSNFADFLPDGAPSTFSSAYGWQYRDTTLNGKFYKECVAWEPTAASMSLIFYAPNHFRAWRTEDYWKIGGHNPHYELADDHELVVRTFIHRKTFHIDKLLYLYRMGDNNSWSKSTGKIADLTWGIYQTYIEKLVLRENNFSGHPCYDLGGAFNSPEGWTPVDISPGTPIQADLTKPWPFPDNSVGAFRAHDFLEHLPDKQFTMSEIYRCLKPGGWLLSSTPSALGQGGFCDPTHVSQWVWRSFRYYTDREIAKYIGNDGKMRFMESRLWEGYPSDAHEKEDLLYVQANLVALKPGMDRLPGIINI